MRKIIFSIVMMLTLVFGVSMSAQETVPVFNQNNITVGVHGGVQTNLRDWNAPHGAIAGFTVNHQLTPVFGLSLDLGTGFNNRRNWYTESAHIHNGVAVDQFYAFIDGRVNLMNAIAGFTGSPHVCEVEPMVGFGYGHGFGSWVNNVALGKAGVNVNFNVHPDWTINVTPAVVWNLSERPFMNGDHAVMQFTAGVTYNISSFYGGRTDKLVYTQADFDVLNAMVNDLRRAAETPVVREVVKEVVRVDTVYINRPTESTVAFTINSAKLPAYVPALNAVAANVDSETVVYVTGFASTDGPEGFNQKLSECRSAAVKDYLVAHGVNPDKIIVAGNGETEQFGSDRNYNRVVVVKF